MTHVTPKLKKDMKLCLEDITIVARKSDSYINATQLCKAGGKNFPHYKALK
jgi:hypothetical protein